MAGDEFERHRPFLMGIAYRMLASSAEAEDAVQDTWLRWQSGDTRSIADARAWLSTTIVRICIDRLKSARARRETYPGTWLPEPVLTTTPLDLESIRFGFLVLLERLDPRERPVFLLHQVFDYSHAEIGEMLELSEAASRQALHRAKEHVAAEQTAIRGQPRSPRAAAVRVPFGCVTRRHRSHLERDRRRRRPVRGPRHEGARRDPGANPWPRKSGPLLREPGRENALIARARRRRSAT